MSLGRFSSTAVGEVAAPWPGALRRRHSRWRAARRRAKADAAGRLPWPCDSDAAIAVINATSSPPSASRSARMRWHHGIGDGTSPHTRCRIKRIAGFAVRSFVPRWRASLWIRTTRRHFDKLRPSSGLISYFAGGAVMSAETPDRFICCI